MINLFSERQGITKIEILDPKIMTDGLRNRIWNITERYIIKFRNPRSDDVIKYIWDRFFKQAIGNLHNNGYGNYFLNQIIEKFYKLEWYRIYDFLEFLLNINNLEKANFVNKLNLVFTEERAPYKIIEGMVTPLITGEEAAELKKAIESKYSDASNHLKKALDLYHKRPDADYANSIKESISAVEALARVILNKQCATLGQLAGELNIHPAFKEAIKKLYGWTSDEGGIRHAENGMELRSDEKEARYMLIQCSALVNYVIAKYEK